MALALCEANRVHLVVRTAEILRAKESLEREVLSRMAAGEMTIHFSSTVREIAAEYVDLKGAEEDVRVPAQRVILKIGATPPRRWLEAMGVEFVGEGREARPVLRRGYESTVPGLHLIGAVTGRDLIKLGMNQGYEVVEHVLGRDVVPADEEVLAARLPFWPGQLMGGLSISGDGVEQDDYVSFLGAAGFQPPEDLWADRVKIDGVRMPFLKFPRNPEK